VAPESLASLYDRTAATVFGMLLRIVGERDVAERLLLEVYAGAKKLPDGEADSTASWVIGRTRELGLRWRGSVEASPALRTGATIVPLAPRGRALSLERFEHLDPVDRDLLEWTYFGGLDTRAAAIRSGLTEVEVRRRLGAALRSIAAHKPTAWRGATS
jgi:hypothetical protein